MTIQKFRNNLLSNNLLQNNFIMNIDKWIKQIDLITESFKNKFGNLTYSELNFKPDNQINVWSITQNINHILIVNETYKPVIKSVLEGNNKTPFIGKFNFIVDKIGALILKSVNPQMKRKMKTFPLWEPGSEISNEDILKKFISHQEDLKNMIRSTNDLPDKKIVISSPANKNIVYKLDTAFDIIIAHEQRHFEQAKEILPFLRKN